MNYLKLALYALIAVLVALLAGFLWGRAGRSAMQAQLDQTQVRLDVTEARANLLAARVDLFEVNFGRASQRLEAAKPALKDAMDRASADRPDVAGRLKDVVARVDQAQQQVGRLDQSANTRLGEAIGLLEQVLTAPKQD